MPALHKHAPNKPIAQLPVLTIPQNAPLTFPSNDSHHPSIDKFKVQPRYPKLLQEPSVHTHTYIYPPNSSHPTSLNSPEVFA